VTSRRDPEFVPQRGVGLCGPAALTMMLRHEGIVADVDAVIAACAMSKDGTSAAELINAARRFGCGAAAYQAAVEDLPLFPPPVILYCCQPGHFVVLIETSPTGIVILDPARGRNELRWREVSRTFRGVVIAVTRDAGGAEVR